MADATTEAESAAEGAEATESNEFSSLLKKQFRPKTDRAREAVEERP